MSVKGYVHVTFEMWGCIFALIAAICIFLSRSFGIKERKILMAQQISNAILLISDAFAWIYRGNSGKTGYYMVRISNFIVFIMGYIILAFFTMYLKNSISKDDSGAAKVRFRIIYMISIIAVICVVISQFNHMYYAFDEHNCYYRNKYFMISQIFGIAGMIINFTILMQYRKKLKRERYVSLMSYIVLPIAAMIVQLFFYGVSLLNIAITISMLFMFIESQIEQVKTLVEQERSLNEMRIEIMLSQIKPHFLFNSLTTIKYLCRTDPKEAAQTVDEFSKFLRGNIDALTIRSCIPFENELEHVKNYIWLEQKRFGERIKVEYDIKISDFEIPSFTLQPLVENAIKHGIIKKVEGGTVKIETDSTKHFYTVKVTDNGVGFDMSAPNNDLKSQNNDLKSHIGITNVSGRLESMCKGRLEITSKLNEGTTAVIYIPKQQK